MAKKKNAVKGSASKRAPLSRKYLETHVPDREFNARDFERVGELATFGWNVWRKIVDAAMKNDEVGETTGPETLTVSIDFEIKAVKVRQPDGVVVPLCLGAKMAGNDRKYPPDHQPCLLVKPRGVLYERHEKP